MKHVLDELLSGRHLSADEAERLLETLADAATPTALAGALLAALRAKGETADEIHGFARGMRRLSKQPKLPDSVDALDLVGTGGDGSGSLNLSTGAALVAAAAGQPVVKHGNRSVSSRSGSADVLEALGFALPPDGETALACLAATGFTFLHAPYFHPAMAALATVRRALGVRTVFNLLGPLTNPAEPPFGVIGAFSADAAEKMATSLSRLPLGRAFVVHGAHGWDEATPCGPFLLFDVRPGEVRREIRDPAHAGFDRCTPRALAGGDATENAARLRQVFDGERGPHRDALVLGAALGLEVAGRAGSFDEARGAAERAIDLGRAAGLVDDLIRRSRPGGRSSEVARG